MLKFSVALLRKIRNVAKTVQIMNSVTHVSLSNAKFLDLYDLIRIFGEIPWRKTPNANYLDGTFILLLLY